MLKLALSVATAIHVACMAWTISLPMGQLIPAPFIMLHVPAMLLMAFAHCVHHLGTSQSLGFFLTVTAIEWIWEQTNISFGGIIFGSLSYHDSLIGPKLGAIPVIVPLAFAAICWPAFVITNLLLHGHPVKVHCEYTQQLARSSAGRRTY